MPDKWQMIQKTKKRNISNTKIRNVLKQQWSRPTRQICGKSRTPLMRNPPNFHSHESMWNPIIQPMAKAGHNTTSHPIPICTLAHTTPSLFCIYIIFWAKFFLLSFFLSPQKNPYHSIMFPPPPNPTNRAFMLILPNSFLIPTPYFDLKKRQGPKQLYYSKKKRKNNNNKQIQVFFDIHTYIV